MSNKKVRVSDIAEFLGKDFFGKDLVVLKPADLKNKIAKNSLLFVNLPSYINNDLKNMKNICVLLTEKSTEYKFSYIIVDNPRLEYAKVI